jgi:hypothetical protein
MITPELLKLVGSEKEGLEKIKVVREKCETQMGALLSKVEVGSEEENLTKVVEVIQGVLAFPGVAEGYLDAGPGHAVGHLVNDYLHALILGSRMKGVRPEQLLVGTIGGALHELGCTLMPRYAEADSAIKHAEAGGLKVLDIFQENSFGLKRETQLLVAYSIMAHTHYLKPQEVQNEKGERFVIEPYQDLLNSGEPNLAVQLPRWVDRLHLNGPAYPPRHYLTMVEAHQDFQSDKQSFYSVNYENGMRPLLRSGEEIQADPAGRTFLEHLEMYRSTQNNDSPYGKFDQGEMVRLRELYKEDLEAIIKSALVPKNRSEEEVKRINRTWTSFLLTNTEPTPRGAQVADQLSQMFLELPKKSQLAWASGFETCLERYQDWAQRQVDFLEMVPSEWLSLPGITTDIREVILPGEW